MEFTPMDAVAYRALDRDALEERQALLQNVLAADELPEDITLDDVMVEVDLCAEAITRKNAEAKLQRTKLDAVKAGAGRVVAQSDPAPQTQQRGIQSVNEPEHYSDTMEYRRALADHILRRRPMPYDMQMRANADIADSINGEFSSVGDFTNVIQHAVAFPHSMMAGIIQQLDEYGNIYSKVQKLTLPGAISYKENELEFTAGWINDTQTTPYQEESDPTTFSFTWHQLEVRHSRTTLANALLTDDLKAMVPPALLKAMVKAIEQAILTGNGTTQPLGLTVDPRIVGQGDDPSASGYIAPRAAIIEVGSDQIDDWKFWHSLLYNTATFNRLYRESGEWTFGDSTWGMHIDLLHDEVNRPLTKVDVLNDEAVYKLRGRNVNLVEDALLPSFDSATAGDVIGIFGNWSNYVINTQPGMPMSTVQWSDYETNTEKTRVLTALDGRPVYPYGWAILKKADEG